MCDCKIRPQGTPTLVTVPAVIAASVAFSAVGDGAATRAASIVWFLWLGLVAFWLLQLSRDAAHEPLPDRSPG